MHKLHLQTIHEQVNHEGNPTVFAYQDTTNLEPLPVPSSWKELVSAPDAGLRAAGMVWGPLARLLPRTITMLSRCVQDAAIVLTESKPPSLVYIMQEGDLVLARRGYLPTTEMPDISRRFSVDLHPLYSVHNGWINLYSDDSGPLPTSDWRPIGTDLKTALHPIFWQSGSALGFQISETPAACYMLWSDGDVQRIVDFWKQLDDLLYAPLRGLDLHPKYKTP